MASMTTYEGDSVDPIPAASFPIILGDTLSDDPSSEKHARVLIHYNFKPDHTSSKRTTVLYPDSQPDRFKLQLTDEDGTGQRIWTYDVHRVSKEAHACVYDHVPKTYRFERLLQEYRCNLITSPAESDREPLQQRYPHLNDLSEAPVSLELPDIEADLFDDEDSDDLEFAQENVFDSQRWLNGEFEWAFPEKGAANSSPVILPATPPSAEPAKSSRRLHPTANGAKLIDKPLRPEPRLAEKCKSSVRPAKVKARTKVGPWKEPKATYPIIRSNPTRELHNSDGGLVIDMNPGSQRASTSPQASQVSADQMMVDMEPEAPRRSPDLPRRTTTNVAPSRKKRPTSPPPPGDPSSDESLIIEIEPDSTPKRRLAAPLMDRTGSGRPISMRSAVSSTGSPMLAHTDASSEPARDEPMGRGPHGNANTGPEVQVTPPPAPEDDDDDAALEAELALAFESEDVAPTGSQTVVKDNESESEEE
ncbi:MAG: hypothetical protein M1826_003160 [Phylliscum demangeonii]|nr:MAG: hypothetical protein M1826_003160 [Phylliscum demangeonii]